MDTNRLNLIAQAADWVEDYLETMIADMPHHGDLLKSYLIVSQGVVALRRENEDLRRKLYQINQVLNS